MPQGESGKRSVIFCAETGKELTPAQLQMWYALTLKATEDYCGEVITPFKRKKNELGETEINFDTHILTFKWPKGYPPSSLYWETGVGGRLTVFLTATNDKENRYWELRFFEETERERELKNFLASLVQ
ncbi:MAG: hypothetical protein ACOX2O_04840 [Bdellovibrionota bacterium]|jgi:hypothetical protein